MSGDIPSRRDTRVGRILVSAGVVIVVAWLAIMSAAYVGAYQSEHVIGSDVLYVHGNVRDPARICTLTAADSGFQRYMVPAMPKRGIHLDGTLITAKLERPTRLVCDAAVHVSQGQWVRVLVVTEQWLVFLLGLVVTVVGLSRLGLFRHVSRYP